MPKYGMRYSELHEEKAVGRAKLEQIVLQQRRVVSYYKDIIQALERRNRPEGEIASAQEKLKAAEDKLNELNDEFRRRAPIRKDARGRPVHLNSNNQRIMDVDLDDIQIKPKTNRPYGVRFDRPIPPGGKMWGIWMSGVDVGVMLTEPQGGNRISLHTLIYAEENQRKGIGSIAYDKMEAMLAAKGKVLVPSPEQSPAAKSFWDKRNTRAVS
jgi:hypothetical protein